MNPFTYFDQVESLTPEIAPDSIVSRTIVNEPGVRVILFGLAAGQELSEHTAARPALIHVLRGSATLAAGGQSHEAGPGAMLVMQPNLAHSVVAREETVLLLYLFSNPPD
jgi:quercetin dioxygenase-like cupin family protein